MHKPESYAESWSYAIPLFCLLPPIVPSVLGVEQKQL